MAKRKADTASLHAPEALEPTSDVRVHKRRPTAAPRLALPPRTLAFPKLVVTPSATAQIAAAQCGLNEGEMAAALMGRPVMAATRVFDFVQKADYSHAEQDLRVLLDHFGSPSLPLVASRLQCSTSGIA